VTIAASITASGKTLKPMLIFKGSLKGWIINKESKSYSNSIMHSCQHNAWMDETYMLQWVVVGREVSEDSSSMMKTDGGFTGLYQPIDIRYNKPLEN
jgi:hypothetical protein